jgi:signal transduction histidine kinase
LLEFPELPLVHPDTDHEAMLVRERVRILFEKQKAGLPGIVVMLLTLLTAYRQGAAGSLLAWSAIVLIISLFQAFWLHLYFSDDRRYEPLVWARVLSIFSAMLAFSMSSGAWLFLDTASTWEILLATAFIVFPTFGSIVFAASYLPIHIAWTFFSVAPLGIYYVISDRVDLVFLGYALLFGIAPSVIWFGFVVSKEFVQSLRMRYENIRLVEELQVQKKLADKAYLDKSRFLAAASHDLRQPNQALGLFLESLDHLELDSDKRKIISKAKQAFAAMRNLLDQLLDISKLDAQTIQPEMRAIRLQPLLHALTMEHIELAERKGLELRLRPTDAIVMADPLLLNRIVSNLISNAIRYTKHGGVLLGVRRRGSRWRIQVCDTGVGIASKEQETIFQEFTQLDNPERDREKGLGLGLAIVRRLARMMGTEIMLSSLPGRGSSFFFEIAEGDAAKLLANEPGGRPNNIAVVEGLKIAVIDDDKIASEGMVTLLKVWKAEVHTFASGELCMGFLRSKAWVPDALIVDYRLRGSETGLTAIEAIRRFLRRDVPALIVTGDTGHDQRILGADMHVALLHKPIAPEELKGFLNKAR